MTTREERIKNIEWLKEEIIDLIDNIDVDECIETWQEDNEDIDYNLLCNNDSLEEILKKIRYEL